MDSWGLMDGVSLSYPCHTQVIRLLGENTVEQLMQQKVWRTLVFIAGNRMPFIPYPLTTLLPFFGNSASKSWHWSATLE